MGCPKCDYDLSDLEIFDNINQEHYCLGCGILLFLDYDEWCDEYSDEEFIDCYDMFEWKLKKDE